MKTKYIIMAVFNGVTKQFEFPLEKQAEAISWYKNIKLRADRVRMFSIDSDDPTMWYDFGKLTELKEQEKNPN